jgi:hypothetical protein
MEREAMNNSELEMAVHKIKSLGLLSFFERLADDGGKNVPVTPGYAGAITLADMGLIRVARGKATITEKGWSVSTRIAAHAAKARGMALGPSHVRTQVAASGKSDAQLGREVDEYIARIGRG